MIKFYGRKDLGTGILRNLSDGGEGPANPSPEARRRNAETSRLQYYRTKKEGLSGVGNLTEEQEKRRKENARKGKAEWNKLNPEYNGGSLGRTCEQHSADSARAAQKGVVKWTKEQRENNPEFVEKMREVSKQNGLKNAELGRGVCGLTKEQRSANTKALFEGEDGEERKEFYREKSKREFESGTGMYSEEAKQKRHDTYYENGYNMDSFTIVSPWVKHFQRKVLNHFVERWVFLIHRF